MINIGYVNTADRGKSELFDGTYLIFNYSYPLLGLLAENVVQKGGFPTA
jgi:hypothetical protein